MNKNKSLFSLIGKHKKNVFFGVIGLTMVDAIMLLIPIIVGNVITQLSEMESSAISINIINKSALYLLVCGVVMAFFRFVWRYFLMGTARRIERDLREEYFLRLQRLPMKFFNNYNAGDLMARGVNDIETIKMACGFGIVVAYDGIVLLAFIFVCMFLISPEFTIYASLPFILMSFFIIKYGHAIERLFLNVQKSFSKLTEETRRIVFSIKVIKSLNDQKNQINKFTLRSKSYESENMKLIKIWAGYQPVITFMAGISILVLIFVGSNMVLEGKITIGNFSSLMVYLTMLSWPVIAMGLAVDYLKRGTACITRVQEVISESEEDDESALKNIDNIEKIELRNVNFSYNDSARLKNLSFTIEKSSNLGITGKTGSGKSTLLSLILKFNKARNIYINDIEINLINKSSIRSKILYVPQEPIIFSGILRENVSFFENNVDEEKVIQCLGISNFLKDLNNMPDGLDTIIGERGLNLSGGQRQRLSLARALYQNPEVLILDDTLSSLDVETELSILRNLKKHFSDRILIVVSSRISTIYSFENILVLDNGEIIQSGNSNHLENDEGLFKDLVKIQKILPSEN